MNAHAIRNVLRVLLLAALGLSAPSFAQQAFDGHDAHETLTEEQRARYQTLAQELRCLVCQNQNIADSDAPLAADLREQLRLQLTAGRSDAEITDYLTARYGDFVLYRPPFKASTWLLWLGPFVLLLVALVAALRMVRLRRRAVPPAAPAVDEARLRRLLDEERLP